MTATLVTVPGVEIIATGTWQLSSGEATFTRADLADAIDAATCPSVGEPILKLGHADPRFDGEPAVGRVAGMKLTAGGNKITADLAGMPEWLGDIIASAYPSRSIEGYRAYVCQQGHEHPFVIKALALLGVTPPAIGVLNSIEDVAALYVLAAAAGPESGQKWKVTATAPGPPKRGFHWVLTQEQYQAAHDHAGAQQTRRKIAVRYGHGAKHQPGGTGMSGRKISDAQAEKIVDRNICRGPIPESRRGVYLAMAARGEDITFADELAAVDKPIRAAAPPPADTTYSTNPLLDEGRIHYPELVDAAMADDQNPPRLFGDRDLPLITASGLDPHLLGSLPWMLRRPVAQAATMKDAYAMIDRYTGGEAADLDLSGLRYARANQDYLAEFSTWLVGTAGRASNAGPPQGLGVTASAAHEDTEERLHEQLFGHLPAYR
jgi:hypothetical protein